MRKSIDELAIFGGTPIFQEKIHVGRPNIGNREHLLTRINDILDRRWLTNNGHYVQELEKRIAKFVGVKHCIVICNGTIALEIAIRALGMTGEVILPSVTFIATAHALQWQEITPIFADVTPDNHNIDPVEVERMITPRTSGIIGVHLWGNPCNIDTLSEIVHKRGLKLLFDASHAFACSYKGQMIGSFGSAEVFSFHATKIINSFEGGAIVTNDDKLADKIRLMKNFGFDGYDNVIYVGTNGKMNEVSAAMCLTSIESLDEFTLINRRNYKYYQSEIDSIKGITFKRYNENEHSNYQYIVVEVDKNKTNLTLDEIIRIFHAENILVRRYFYPGCHQMEPYKSYFPHAGLVLPNTESLLEKVICLPTGQTISTGDIEKICNVLRFVINKGEQIKKKLQYIIRK
jgi:dTDP-4-amino-4,6-dideoxygalactose transaminase